ncbi:MAG: hypothetical protein NTW21_39835 [Verrucomicrobia bacterium]|nr:hypothetical protein [Verrucomicrobiota bacterium]
MNRGQAINASGQVAGYSYLPGNSIQHAVRWTGAMPQDLGTLGGHSSYGFGINDSGQIAGQSSLSGDLSTHAVRWTGTTPQDLGTLGGLMSHGFGINAAGQVAGYSDRAGSGPHAVRWTGTTAEDLGTLPGGISLMSQGFGINAAGQVAGWSQRASGPDHAVRWTGTTPEDLGALGTLPGSTHSKACGINASGQVVGWSFLSGEDGPRHAVRWTGTTAEDLGTLGGPDSEGYAINTAGDVVGMSHTKWGYSHAFLHTGGTMYDLNDLLLPDSGVTYLSVAKYACINDLGQIAASGYIGGETHAILLTPSFMLTITSPYGTVTGGGYYLCNTPATLTATPSPGYLFTGWTGDASGTANPLSVLMDSDKTITANFTPDTNDDDGDGWTNYQEIVEHGTNPALWDTDGDGVKDSKDAFPLDPAETLDTDHDGIGDNADPDDDGDGLSDVDEINTYGTNPKRADSDGDGLTDPDELRVYLTNPLVADMDNDGLSDGAEVFTHHTDPKVADSDGDGFLDGYEVLTGKSPTDNADHPALVAEARMAIEFTFPSAIGKTYRIETSLDLATWTAVESGIAGNGGVIQRFYTTRNMPKRYFRVEEGTP